MNIISFDPPNKRFVVLSFENSDIWINMQWLQVKCPQNADCIV
jgi:hypothetical protein